MPHTTLIIPGENDSEDEIAELCDWMVKNLGPDVPMHFSAFHPDFKILDKPPTSGSILTRAREQARKAGLRHVFTGNVSDPKGQSTFCPSCNALLIERDWYRLGHWGIKGGACCAKCGTAIPGRFAEKPGAWGARRMPIRIA